MPTPGSCVNFVRRVVGKLSRKLFSKQDPLGTRLSNQLTPAAMTRRRRAIFVVLHAAVRTTPVRRGTPVVPRVDPRPAAQVTFVDEREGPTTTHVLALMAPGIAQIKAGAWGLRTKARLSVLGMATISVETAGTMTATCSSVTRSLATPHSVSAALDTVTLLKPVVYRMVSRGSTAVATSRRSVPAKWVLESHLPG
jgi:hypothetical protein